MRKPHSGFVSQKSSLFNAGSILLLIGAILQAFSVLFLLGMVFLASFFSGASTDDNTAANFIQTIYGSLALIVAIGSVLAFMAWQKSRQGDARGAGIFGIIASMVPPVSIVTLIGAILCFTSTEAQQNR